MQVIRIKLKQNKAHYGRAECVENRMTYPLPPYSTIIGAVHNACGYSSYHPMNISIQGRFQSMQKEIHNQQILLNHREDDRGILIYLQSPNKLSEGYKIVGRALKKQGNSFKDNRTIRIVDRNYMEEYWNLLGLKESLDEENKNLKDKKKMFKQEEKRLKEYLKSLDKTTDEYSKINEEIKNKNKIMKDEEEAFKIKREVMCERPLLHFQTLTISPRYVEVLYGVELVLHIQSDEEVLNDIEASINNFTCLGRSEDFVDVLECKKVELLDNVDREYTNKEFAGYIERKLLAKNRYSQDFDVYLSTKKEDHKGIQVRGTTYYIPKNYIITEKGRQFEYKKVTYVSEYCVDKNSKNIFVDLDGYIVNLV